MLCSRNNKAGPIASCSTSVRLHCPINLTCALSMRTLTTVKFKMVVSEIFYSIQGESSYFGLPCVFVRLTACSLRCSYCDTEYAFYEGHEMSVDDIAKKVKSYGCELVEITGGEPLLQKESIELMEFLLKENYTVLLETSGAVSIKDVPERVVKIMDIKCPSSREAEKNLYDNIALLKPYDEVKFVLGSREDYDFAKKILKEHNITQKAAALFSPVYGKLELKELAGWMLKDSLKVRLQTQFHKIIWGENVRGV